MLKSLLRRLLKLLSSHQIITCVEKYGPYIIIMPGVAMPHAQEFGTGVKKISISFMKVNQPVYFDLEEEEKKSKFILYTRQAKTPKS